MKCTECNCILSPEEEDLVLQALAEGIVKPICMCEDCVEFIERYAEDDFGDEDDW